LHSFTSPEENILDYGPWLLQRSNGVAWQPAPDMQCRRHKQGFVAALEGVVDRDAAAELRGTLVGVAADALPPIAQDSEFYWHDLAGCRVDTVGGQSLGRVDHLIETGANDVLVIVREGDDSNGQEQQLLIPFAREFVTEVDIVNRTITVDWDPQW
jgi:16S rRNA processing protein RimM